MMGDLCSKGKNLQIKERMYYKSQGELTLGTGMVIQALVTVLVDMISWLFTLHFILFL